MALTVLDEKAALIVIDLQKGIVPLAQDGAVVVERSAELARAFRAKGLPVVLVNVTAPAPGRTNMGPRNFAFPEGWTDLVPKLGVESSDLIVSKERGGGVSWDEAR